jgi:hypothetical protein
MSNLDGDAFGLGGGTDHIDRKAGQRGDVDVLHVETELAGDDPRDVEQVLDHAALCGGIPLDRLERSDDPLR